MSKTTYCVVCDHVMRDRQPWRCKAVLDREVSFLTGEGTTSCEKCVDINWNGRCWRYDSEEQAIQRTLYARFRRWLAGMDKGGKADAAD